MLGKAIKHEFRATGRVMLPLYAIVLFISFLAHFAVRGLDAIEAPGMLLSFLMIVTVILFSVGLMAVAVMTFVQILQRFRSNVLGDEGYLTMTLPMSTHTLLWSKLIVSLVWVVCAVLIIALSAFIVAFEVEFIDELRRGLEEFLEMLFQIEGSVWLRVLEAVGTAVLGVFSVCLSFYAALSVGYGFTRHKVVLSIVVYIVLTSVMNWLTNLLWGVSGWGFLMERQFMTTYTWQTLMGRAALNSLLEGAVFYLITVWNLNHRLNLE